MAAECCPQIRVFLQRWPLSLSDAAVMFGSTYGFAPASRFVELAGSTLTKRKDRTLRATKGYAWRGPR